MPRKTRAIHSPGMSISQVERRMKDFAEDLDDTDRRLKKLEKAIGKVKKIKRTTAGSSQAEVDRKIDALLKEIGPAIFN